MRATEAKFCSAVSVACYRGATGFVRAKGCQRYCAKRQQQPLQNARAYVPCKSCICRRGPAYATPCSDRPHQKRTEAAGAGTQISQIKANPHLARVEQHPFYPTFSPPAAFVLLPSGASTVPLAWNVAARPNAVLYILDCHRCACIAVRDLLYSPVSADRFISAVLFTSAVFLRPGPHSPGFHLYRFPSPTTGPTHLPTPLQTPLYPVAPPVPCFCPASVAHRRLTDRNDHTRVAPLILRFTTPPFRVRSLAGSPRILQISRRKFAPPPWTTN